MKMIPNLKRILNKLKKIHLNKVEQVLIYIFIIESLTNTCMKMIPNLKQIWNRFKKLHLNEVLIAYTLKCPIKWVIHIYYVCYKWLQSYSCNFFVVLAINWCELTPIPAVLDCRTNGTFCRTQCITPRMRPFTCTKTS